MKIVCFPEDSNNPYQEMLYRPMRAAGVPVAYLTMPTKSATLNLLTFMPQLVWFRLRGYTVFHLHWVIPFAPASLPWRSRFGKRLLYLHYAAFLSLVKLLGYKLVWTAHNALPLMGAFYNDVAARRMLVEKADLVIAHSPHTLEQLEALSIRPKRSIIVPHGSYVGVYPDATTKEEARAKLNINAGAFVYLFFGNINYYKGIGLLLESFLRLKKENALLLIVGECTVPELREKIEKSCSAGNVVWFKGRAEDAMLQYYFAAADIAVLPFTSITTSGSTLLALSFGKAVLVPRMGDLAHLPDSVSYKYNPKDKDGVLTKMEEVYEDKPALSVKNSDALKYAEALSWPAIAEKTFIALQGLV